MRLYRLIFSTALPFLLVLLTSCASLFDPDNLLPAKELADGDSRYIEIDGVNIHYKENGAGSPELLMLHGFLSNIDGWNSIIPDLSKEYRIISYDRLAFGLTERPAVTKDFNPYLPEQAEKRALKLISELKMEKPVLIGHSAGANFALKLALTAPDSFSGLILISPGVYTGNMPELINRFLKVDIFSLTGINTIRSLPAQIDRLVKLAYYRPKQVPEEVIENYTRPLRVENWDYALLEHTRQRDDWEMAKRLSEITLPVLIIHGLQDQVIPVLDSMLTVDLLPNASLLILDDCGHIVYEEQTAKTTAAIMDFINRL